MFHIQTPVLNDKLRSVQREEKKEHSARFNGGEH